MPSLPGRIFFVFQKDSRSGRIHLNPQPSLTIPILGYPTVKRGAAAFGSHRSAEKQLPKSKLKLLPRCNAPDGRGIATLFLSSGVRLGITAA